MNNVEYREKFRSFLADDARYCKFVEVINRGRDARLFFWQERAIEKFCAEYSLLIPSYEELREIFDICELHGNTLEHGMVSVFHGHVDYSREYTKACQELFPNSYLSEVNGPKEMYGKNIEIRFCQACRDAENRWKS